MDVLNKIEATMPTFSKGQKAIGHYMLEHYDKAAYMTALKLGQVVGVSESTVVRFAIELGFDGYPSLQKSLRELIRNKLTATQRIEITSDRIGNGDILEKVIHSDIENMRNTLDAISRETFNAAVDAIIDAENIYIIGVRSASTLASFMYFYLNLVFPNVRFVNTASSSEMFEHLFRLSDRDVVIGISFPRYSKKIVSAMKFSSSQGAKTIAITDSLSSPIAPPADHVLVARSDMASFVDSLVAPLSIINAIIVAIAQKKRAEVSDVFEKLEKIWDEYDVYDKENK